MGPTRSAKADSDTPVVRTVRDSTTRRALPCRVTIRGSTSAPARAPLPGHDSREHLVHEEPAHLARHAGEQHHHSARVLDPEPGCRAAWIGENDRAFGNFGLRAVDGWHRTAHPIEPCLDAREQ